MKHSAVAILSLILLVTGSCLKGRFQADVVIPESRMDSVFLNYFRLNSGITAGEGTTSITLADKRVLWLFGSSHINDFDAGTAMIACASNVHNAALISDQNMTMQTLNNGIMDFIPGNETGKWFIPLHGYQYADTVFVFMKKMGGLPNNRSYIAKLHFPDLQLVRIDSFLYNNTLYGYNIFTDSSKGFVYCYGLFSPLTINDNTMHLARFRMNNVHDTWQFYAGDNIWVNAASGATPLASIPGENFTIQKIRNKYVLLTQEKGKVCNKGQEIYSYTAPNPWGSFLNGQLLHTIKDSLNDVTPGSFGVSLHPQFLNTSDEVLVTYALNGYEPCVATCVGGLVNPDYYRIRTLRVSLKKIDPAF